MENFGRFYKIPSKNDIEFSDCTNKNGDVESAD